MVPRGCIASSFVKPDCLRLAHMERPFLVSPGRLPGPLPPALLPLYVGSCPETSLQASPSPLDSFYAYLKRELQEAIPIQGYNEMSTNDPDHQNEEEAWPANPWKMEIDIAVMSGWPLWMCYWVRFLSKPFIWCLACAFVPKSWKDRNNRTAIKIVIISSISINNIRFLLVY